MGSVITWRLSLNEVEIGKEVEFFAEGIAPHTGLPVLITLPSGALFMWGVQSDSYGKVHDRIKLDSGLGQYLFCIPTECGSVSPRCAHLNVCPCSTVSVKCNVTVTGPSRIVRGTQHTFKVTGLLPSKLVTAQISNNEQTAYSISGISSVSGEFLFDFTHNVAGIYSLTFSDGSCTSAPMIVTVANSQSEFPVLVPDLSSACEAAVDATLTFNKATYVAGETGTLKARICNRGAEFRQIALATTLSMPGATITSNPVPAALGLSGYRCEEYTILFNAGTTDTNYSANIYGSYECQGKYFTANGGAANAIVGVGQGVCSAVLQYFGASAGTSVSINTDVELEIQVYNAGNKIIDSASLLQLNLPEHVTVVDTLPLVSEAIPPGESKTITVAVQISQAGSYTINLPADKLVFTCSGAQTPIGSPGFVTLTAT